MQRKFLLILSILTSVFFVRGEDYIIAALPKIDLQERPKHPTLELVADGKLNFAIAFDTAVEGKDMLNTRRSIRLGVDALQDAFQRVTGISPEVFDAKSPELSKYRYVISVGKNIITEQQGFDPLKLPPEGFVVRSFAGGVMIAGWDGSLVPGTYNAMDWGRYRFNGSTYGAYDFCERVLGIRYYYPGIGVYAPKLDELRMPAISYSSQPEYRDRYNWAFMGQFNPRRMKPEAWPWPGVDNDAEKMQHAWRMARSTRYMHGHSPDPEAIAAAFPELRDSIFFRDKNGHLYCTPEAHIGNYFDVTNPEFVRLLVDWYKKYLASEGKWRVPWGRRNMPNSEYFLFGQADTFIDDISNERSKPFLPAETANNRSRKFSDVYANFYIDLAKNLEKELPGAKLNISLYHNYTSPPFGKWEYPQNIRVKLCTGTPALVRSPLAKEKWQRFYEGWHQVLQRPMAVHWYGVQTNAFSQLIQGYYTRELIDFLKKYLSKDGIMIDAGGGNHHFYCSYYLAYRTLWDPSLDPDAALDEHWPLLYGQQAGKFLKEFYDTVRLTWEEQLLANLQVIETTSVPPDLLYKAFNLKIIDSLENLLKLAQEATPADSLERKRVDFFMQAWGKEFASVRAYLTHVLPEAKVGKLAAGEKIVIDGYLDEQAWARAAIIPMCESAGGRTLPTDQPSPRLLWSEDGLYVAFSATGKPAMVKGDLWNRSNNFEVFISPGNKKESFYHFALSCANDFHQGYRRLLPIEAAYDSKWRGDGVEYFARADENGWSAEIFIPFAAIGAEKPKPYSSWFGNIVASNHLFSPKFTTSFSLTMKNNHNYNLFGRIKFMGDGD